MKHRALNIMLFFVGIVIFSAGFGLAWFSASQLEGNTVIFVLACAGLLLLGISSAISTFIQSYISGTQQLIHETTFITTTDPAYRSQLTVPADMHKLAQTINALADLYQSALSNQAEQMKQAQTTFENANSQLVRQLSALTKGEQTPLAKLNRALELLEQNPDLAFDSRSQLHKLIKDASLTLNSQLNEMLLEVERQ